MAPCCVGIGNTACVSSAKFHDSQPSLGSGQSIYPICMLNRTVPGEFLEINSCFLNIHIPRFQHVAAVRRQGTASPALFYLDGFQGKPGESLNTIGDFTFSTSDESSNMLTIGIVGSQSLEGYLAEVRLWSIERTARDILQNFHRHLSPAETPNTASKVVGYWPGESGLPIDFSPTKNTTNVNNR